VIKTVDCEVLELAKDKESSSGKLKETFSVKVHAPKNPFKKKNPYKKEE
jgi:hypothetical protein